MAAAEIIEKLTRHGKTVAVAESCTGGMICSMLVEQVGASACFAEGYVTYSNEAKEKNLGVSHEVLEACGAVSEQTARQMAEGVRRRGEADYGVAATGIAGPDGGTAEKPVGLVYIACAHAGGTQVERHVFSGDRTRVRTQAAERALALLEECMAKEQSL